MISWINQKFRRLTVKILLSEGSRVECRVGGAPLWFECDQVPLGNAADAVASLCFAASALHGWKVRFPSRICPDLATGLKRISRIWGRWWSLQPMRFEAKRRIPGIRENKGRKSATFLSLGVDSFYTLLRMHGIETIVYVAGYDVRLDETERLGKIERSLCDVAEKRGLNLILVKTNLREHPVFEKIDWTRFHGAALAAVGHLLAAHISRVVISSSFSLKNFDPWGTSWKTDFLWSSSRLEIVHFGESLRRVEKLEEILDEALVREHLRICWEHRNDGLNCGECEKCLRTMLCLVSLGKLEHYPTFPDERGLVRGLQGARALKGFLIPAYQAIPTSKFSPDVRQALHGLIRRSEARLKEKSS